MIHKIIIWERLLNHQQVVLIEPFEMIAIVQRVCRVCINRKQYVWVAPANLINNIQIPPGFDFKFDSLIAKAEEPFNSIKELRNRWLDTETDTHRYLLLSAANQ